MSIKPFILPLALLSVLASACLGARSAPRSYFVMHGEPRDEVAIEPLIKGMVRVRNLDTDAVYEKFQIVVRRSPYQLRYSDSNVWAVKPNQMVADLVGQAIETANIFSTVTRELLDVRPDFTLSGQLHALEVYDSDDLWFAHLAISLYLTRFSDGGRLWSMEFDQRKKVNAGDFGHGARALSELLEVVMTQAIAELSAIDVAKGAPTAPRLDPAVDRDDTVDPRAPVLIPEEPREDVDAP